MRSALHQQGSKESATLQPFFTLQLDIQVGAWAQDLSLTEIVTKNLCLAATICAGFPFCRGVSNHINHTMLYIG